MDKNRTLTRRRRLGPMLLVCGVLVLVVGLAVSAQAETLPLEAPPAAAGSIGPIKTHSNADRDVGDGGVQKERFSLACGDCHDTHEAPGARLLKAEGAALCATCHDLDTAHDDPALQQDIATAPVWSDCLTCHPHSAGFMPVSGAKSLTLAKRVVGFDDLDEDGHLSPGDRVLYRLDYENPGPEEVTGVVLRDEPDAAHVAVIEAVAGEVIEGDAPVIQWDLGTLTAGAAGYVTYNVVLLDASSFEGGTTTTTTLDGWSSDGSAEFINIAVLIADDRESVSVSNVVSVAVEGASLATEAAETTGPPSTTSTTLPESNDVVNKAVLIADDREPVIASEVISVTVPGVPSPAPTTTTTEDPAAVSDPSALTLAKQALGYDDLDADGHLSPGDRVHYRIDYANPGPDDATGTILRDEPDAARVAAVEAITDGGALEVTDFVVEWDLGTLPAGASGHVTYDVVLRDATFFSGSMPTTTTTAPDPSALTLAKQALGYDDLDANGHLSPGDRVHYRIDYANPGPDDATGVALSDQPDAARVAAVEAVTQGGSVDGGSVRWMLGTVAGGASGFVTYDVVLAGDGAFEAGPTQVVNSALLSADNGAPVSVSEAVSVTRDDPVPTTSPAPMTTEAPATTEAPTTTIPTESPTTTALATSGPEVAPVAIAAVVTALGVPGAIRRRFSTGRKGSRRRTIPPDHR